MGTQEQLVELKPEEIAILKTYKQTGGGYGCATFLAIVLAVIFFFLRRVLPLSYWRSALFNVAAITVVALAILFLAFLIYVQWEGQKKANELVEQDIQGGYKKIITRQVESQHITGHEDRGPYVHGFGSSLMRKSEVQMAYNLVIDGTPFSASEELYMKLKPGDKIYFHVGPKSNSILYYTIDSDEGKYYLPSALKRIN